MKKIFTILVAILIGHSVFASSTSMGNWRWKNDNGADSTAAIQPGRATWRALENTAITLTNNSNIRLRIADYSNNQTGGLGTTTELRYSTSPTTGFVAIPDVATPGNYFVMSSSNYVANAATSLEQLSNVTQTSASYTNSDPYGNGVIFTTTNGQNSSTNIAQNTKYEIEYNFKPSQYMPTTPDTYYFRLYASGQTPGTVLSGIPSLTTTATVLPIVLADFSVSIDASGNAQIAWVTSSENNSASYVIESSIDGSTFATLATVASKNLATGASYSYSYTKGLPQGINYFRLKSVDKDGSFTYSDVKLANVTNTTSKITIAPNPVSTTLNISGLESGNTIQVYNINVQKVLSVIATGASVQKIDVSKLSHGAYYVQVLSANKTVSSQLIIKQ